MKVSIKDSMTSMKIYLIGFLAPRVLCQLWSELFAAFVRFLGDVIGFCYLIGVGAELGFD